MQNKQVIQINAPSLFKLGACLMYDTLVVIALCIACAGAFVWLVGDAAHGIKRYLLQLFLWLSVGVYFVWCWHKSGQTLAMQTWQLKLVRQNALKQNARLVSLRVAFARYILASISFMLFGLGFLWAIVDRDRLFLHDRILKTKIIHCHRRST